MQEAHEALKALETACKEAVEADNVFTGEGTLARRKIRDALAGLEAAMEEVEKAPLASETEERDPEVDAPPEQSGSGSRKS